jgi:endoglucanase
MKARLTTYMIGGTLLLLPVVPALTAMAFLPAYAQDATMDGTMTDKRPIVHPNQTKFGAYDPHGDFSGQGDLVTEALFLPWEDVDLETLRVADAYAAQRGRKLLITIEPWSWNEDWRLSSDQLRKKVLNGDYDANIQAISAVVKTLKSPVIIRWGQEMEDTSGRFSWSDWPPQDYISAYKRVADQFRKDVPSIRVMWSPKGVEGLEKYYPGDDYVDIIGLSVFGLQPYDKKAYGQERTFADALQPGYNRVKGYDKPIFVAELGYEGDPKYMKPWIETATKKDAQFPGLQEVVYFNDRDVIAWPFDLGRPNWRVKQDPTTN